MATFRVPVYDAPQVQPQAAPSGRLQIAAPAEAFGSSVGQALGGISQQIAQEVDAIDRKRVEESVNELHLVDANTVVDINSKKGKQALEADPTTGKDPFAPVMEARKKNVTAIAEKLSTPRQQRLFNEIAAKHDADMLGRITGHRAQEEKVWKDSVSKGTLATSTQLVAVNADNPEKLTEHFAAMDAAVAALNPGQDVAALQESYRSKAALGAVQQAVMNHRIVPGHLMDYMTPEDATKAKKLAEEGDVETVALQAREEVYYKDMTPEAMESVATSISSAYPDTVRAKMHKAVIQQLRDRAQSDKVTQQTYDSDTYSKAVTHLMIEGGNTATIKAQALGDKALSDEGRAKMAQLVHTVEKQRKAEYESDPQADAKLYQAAIAFTTNDEFAHMSQDEITKSLPNWGRYASLVQNSYKSATAAGGKLVAPSDAKMAVQKSLGINTKNEVAMTEFNTAIGLAVDEFSRNRVGKGKYATAEPTHAEWVQRIKFYAEPRVYKKGFFSPDRAALATASPEQMVGMANNIPADEKKIISDALAWEGRKFDETQPVDILRMWESLKRKRQSDPKAYQEIYKRSLPGTDTFTEKPTRPLGGR